MNDHEQQQQQNAFYSKLCSGYLRLTMAELKEASPTILTHFVIHLLKNKKSPLRKEMYFPGPPIYCLLLCWRQNRIGLKQIEPIRNAWQRQKPCAVVVVSTSGFKEELIDYAKATDIPFLLLDLEQLAKDLFPSLRPFPSPRRKPRQHNIIFLP